MSTCFTIATIVCYTVCAGKRGGNLYALACAYFYPPPRLHSMEQLDPVLLTLLITAIGTLTAWVERVRRDLTTNTSLTREAKDASNGRLSEVIDRLAAERDRTMGLRFLVRERDDRLAYLISRIPEAESLMQEYHDRRDARLTAADEREAERHVMMDDQGSTRDSRTR